MAEQTVRPGRWERCPACGYSVADWENRCEKCGRRLPPGRGSVVSQAGAHRAHGTARPSPASGNRRLIPKARPPALPEHLRRELRERVEQYRARQANRSLSLPFNEPEPSDNVIAFPAPTAREGSVSRSRSARGSYQQEAIASAVPQTELEFSAASSQEEAAWLPLSVAPLQRRLRGHLTDVGVLAGAMAVFLLPFPLLVGRVVPDGILLGGIACSFLLLAVLYGLIFLVRAGMTPGMRSAGLRLVTFDGMPTTPRQRFWRMAGVVVSAGSFLIGFLWAALDEEKLYWHDHISKTFLTTWDR